MIHLLRIITTATPTKRPLAGCVDARHDRSPMHSNPSILRRTDAR
jgi:hypothetical protein